MKVDVERFGYNNLILDFKFMKSVVKIAMDVFFFGYFIKHLSLLIAEDVGTTIFWEFTNLTPHKNKTQLFKCMYSSSRQDTLIQSTWQKLEDDFLKLAQCSFYLQSVTKTRSR